MPPAGVFGNKRSNGFLTMLQQSGPAVQAGAPMTATEEAALPRTSGQSAHFSFFCSQLLPPEATPRAGVAPGPRPDGAERSSGPEGRGSAPGLLR